jgi:hypothetical protein
LQKSAIVGVEDRKSAARSVARSDGGAVNHWQFEIGCDGPCSVQHLASASADDHLRALVAGLSLDALDLG